MKVLPVAISKPSRSYVRQADMNVYEALRKRAAICCLRFYKTSFVGTSLNWVFGIVFILSPFYSIHFSNVLSHIDLFSRTDDSYAIYYYNKITNGKIWKNVNKMSITQAKVSDWHSFRTYPLFWITKPFIILSLFSTD